MGSTHTPADDIVYNLISVQYHALKAAQTYDQYIADARQDGHDDVAGFLEECARQDADRARRCHELLTTLTKGHGISGG